MIGNINNGILRHVMGFMLKRVHSYINCKEFEDFIVSYLDGELSERQQSVFEWHLRICPACREYLAAYQCAMEVGRAALPSSYDSVPGHVPEDLIRAILDARKQ
jgi:anti-sigma factor RsiW